MKHVFYSLGLILLFACNNQEKEARMLLDEARMQYAKQEYLTAKQYLDSLKVAYPKEFSVQRERQALVKEIEYAEQTRNLMYCDSLLTIREPEVEVLKKNFIFEQDTAYEATGKYVHKSQRIERNVQRSYLRANVQENGELLLASVYYGAKPIKHTALKASLKGGEYAQTEPVTYDGANNYSFTDGGMTTEIVSYSKGKDNGVAAFIGNHQTKELIRLSFLGDREYVTTLFAADKEAISACYRLSLGILEVERLKKEKQIAQTKIEYLKEKMKQAEE